MNIKVEQRKTLKDMKVEIAVNKYYLYVTEYYTSNEKCNDKGFEFYANVIKSGQRTIEISKERYHSIQSQLIGRKTALVYGSSGINNYDNTIKGVSTKKENQFVPLLKAIDTFIESKAHKKALITIQNAIDEINTQFADYSPVFKDEFIDSWNQSVQDDINTLNTKIQTINEAQEIINLKKEKRKSNKIWREYKQLLAEKDKYSDVYFAKLEKELLDSHNITKEFLNL